MSSKLFIPVGIILLASFTILSSISRQLFYQQLVWAVLGVGIILFFRRVDWRLFFNYRWVIWGLYALAVLLLVLTHFTAPLIRNAKSWLVLGPLSFQPVELVKIALILLYAEYFSRRHLAVARWGNILTSFALFAVPAALVAVQPNLGSSLILFGIWFGFLLASGLPRKRVVVALIAFIVVGVVGWNFGLKNYQRERIRAVFYPEQSVLTYNYSVVQSKIAIGSAGFWGKGYGQGSQAQLGFLSVPETDFALAALIEEWGVAVGILVVAALAYLIVQVLRVGMRADHNFEKFICLGTAMVFGIHFLLNAGSVVGLTPVIGVTFPFLSYGGSSLLTNFFLLALVNAIRERI
jgi:rod shape determining protein RodA